MRRRIISQFNLKSLKTWLLPRLWAWYLDESGKGVPNTPVLAILGWEENAEKRVAKADGKGGFVFQNLKEGYWFFSVDVPDFAKEWDHERGVLIPIDKGKLPLEIHLFSPRSLKGQVIDEKNKSVADVTVTLVLEFIKDSEKPVQGHLSNDLQVTQTDANGRFQLVRLRPGKISLLLDHPEFARTLVDTKVESGEHTFVIHEGLNLKGRVLYQGKPAANVPINAGLTALSHRSMGDWNTITDEKGEFEIHHIADLSHEGLDEGTIVYLEIDNETWTSPRYRVYLSKDKSYPIAEMNVEKKGEAKEEKRDVIEIGNKTDKGNCTIKARLAEMPPKEWFKDNPSFDLISMDERPAEKRVHGFGKIRTDGTYEFKNTPPGIFRITTWGCSPFFYCEDVRVGAGETKEAVLHKGPGRIHGIIRWGESPPAKKYLSWFLSPKPAGVFQGSATLFDDGRYEIEGLPFGKYKLIFSGENAMPSRFNVELKEPDVIFDIALPQSMLSGQLIGITPEPPKPHRDIGQIFVRPRGVPPMLGELGAFLDADNKGHFEVRYLPPGLYTITGYDCKAEVEITDNNSRVEMNLKKPEKTGEISGGVSGELNLTEYGSLYINAFQKDRLGYDFGVWYQYAEMDKATRRYRLKNLPVGLYGVFVSGYSSSAPFIWIPEIEVREGLSRKLDIGIPEGGKVSVKFDQDMIKNVKSWRLRMPSGDWLDYTLFTGSSLVGSFALPLGEYEMEINLGEKGVVRKKIVLTIRGQTL